MCVDSFFRCVRRCQHSGLSDLSGLSLSTSSFAARVCENSSWTWAASADCFDWVAIAALSTPSTRREALHLCTDCRLVRPAQQHQHGSCGGVMYEQTTVHYVCDFSFISLKCLISLFVKWLESSQHHSISRCAPWAVSFCLRTGATCWLKRCHHWDLCAAAVKNWFFPDSHSTGACLPFRSLPCVPSARDPICSSAGVLLDYTVLSVLPL